MSTYIRGVALAALLVSAFLFPDRAAHAVPISFTSTVEAPVRYLGGTPTYFDVSFGGKPSVPGGPCPVFCSADLAEGATQIVHTNVELWSFSSRPDQTLVETRTLTYDLTITLAGVTVTRTVAHDMRVTFRSYNETLLIEKLGGPVSTFDFGSVGKIDVWIASSLFNLSPMHNGSGIQLNTMVQLRDFREVSDVAEPASAALLLSGIGLAAVLRRRRSRQA